MSGGPEERYRIENSFCSPFNKILRLFIKKLIPEDAYLHRFIQVKMLGVPEERYLIDNSLCSSFNKILNGFIKKLLPEEANLRRFI